MKAINVALEVTVVLFQVHTGFVQPLPLTYAFLNAGCAGQKGYLA